MSQRHKIVVQGAAANGEVHAQGEIARPLIYQANVDGTVPNVLEGEPNWEVPVGAPGGPLQGSTMIGAIPEAAAPPPDPNPEPDGPTITGIEPPAGIVGEAVTITITGTGFNDGSTVNVDNNAVISAFVSATQMTADLPSVAQTGSVTVTVLTDGATSNGVTFNFIVAEADAKSAAVPGDRSYPIGPFEIEAWNYDADLNGYIFTSSGVGSLETGDVVTIEASGSSEVNGEHNIEVLDSNRAFFQSAEATRTPSGGRVSVLGG